MSSILDHLPLVSFTPGRARYAITRIMARLVEGDAPLRALLVEADRRAIHSADLEARWRVQRVGSKARGQAVALDLQLDRAVTTLYTQLQSLRDMYGDADPLGQRAHALLVGYLPDGAVGLTHRPFEDEVDAVEHLLTALNGPEAEAVEALELRGVVQAITTRHQRLRDELEATPNERMRYDEVRHAHYQMQRGLVRIMGALIGTYGGAEQAERFDELVGPIARQAERIRAIRRSRRRVFDVDPATGEPTDSDTPTEA